MNDVQGRLDAGEVVILDGAMGTELERRGVPMDDVAWDAAALVTHPDLVREVHEDYIEAGADVIITNTFATARHVLGPAGMGGQFRALNIRAVALAKEARDNVADGPVSIAGSISTMSARNDRSYEPRAEKARENYREQAEVLAESGVDVIALEMMRDLEQTSHAAEAAVATGLPVWVGFSCKSTDGGTVVLWDGHHTLAEALEQIPPIGASLLSVMHTLTDDTPAALRELTGRWSGPVGAYPHSGEFVMPHWRFIDMISSEDFTGQAQGWVGMGVQLVGGCCGIGPEHIRLLKERLPKRSP
jgi:S-methylmethionine-dependent homocysteine/selenocysteine methylase